MQDVFKLAPLKSGKNEGQNEEKVEEKDLVVSMTNTVMHLALKSGNNRSVEVLLQFLSKVKFDSSVNFVSVID